MANYPIQNGRGDAVVREDEIYDWFVKPENAALCNYKAEPFAFVRKIIRSADHFVNFAKGRGNDGNANVAMDNLERLTGGAFSLQNILLLAASNFPPALFNHFVQQLESFLFYYIFTKTATKELERNFSIWADELREIGDLTDETSQRLKLNAFLVARLQAGMTAKNAELGDALRRYHLYSMQRYRTRYMLQKFAQYVDMAYTGLKTAGSLADYRGLEIEHILPEKPKADLIEDFRNRNAGLDYGTYKAKLGNLTLLEKPLNIIAGNDFFEKKKSKYQDCRSYLTRSLVQLADGGQNTSITRINAKLSSFPDWSGKTIDERQTLLVALAQDIWRIAPAP
jgi:Protein of unknown function (DUF1524)